MSTTVQSATLGIATIGDDFQLGGTDTITLDGITAAVTFGTDSFVRTLAVSGIDARPAFGAVVLGQTIQPAGIDARPAFGAPTFVPGATAFTPAGLDARGQFGSPDPYATGPFLVGGSQVGGTDPIGGITRDLAVSGFAAPVTFGAPFVGYSNVYAAGIDARATFGTPLLGTAVPVPGVVVAVRFGRVDVVHAPSSTFGAGKFGDGFFGGALSLAPLPVGAAPFVVGDSALGDDAALGGNGVGTQRIMADRIWPPAPQFGAVSLRHVLHVVGLNAGATMGRPSFSVAIFGVHGIDARPTFGAVQMVGTAYAAGIDARATFGTPRLLPVLAAPSVPIVVQWGVFTISHVAGEADDRAFLVRLAERWSVAAVAGRWAGAAQEGGHGAVVVRRHYEAVAVRWRERLSQDVE